jgi:transcriptional regulator GlxA family with amidase domain
MTIFNPSNETLRVILLVIPESSMMSLACVLDVMRASNRLARRKLFSWELLTLTGEAATLSCGLPIHSDGALNTNSSGDVLIIIGGFNQDKHVDNATLIKLRGYMRQFKVIGGIEAGSWIMARAGKLTDKKATTHWEDLEDFALRFPQVNVRPDRYVIDGNVFTTGGASPSFDFMLHLIRSRYGHHLGLEVASAFIYDGIHTGNDAQPIVSLGALERTEPRIAKAIRLMEQHIDEPLTISDIADSLKLSIRMLEYLFQQNLQISPGKYYLRLRLQSARRLVLDTRLPMQVIAVRSGFSSLAAFSRQFKLYFEVSPSSCRKQ